jgi:anti-sigma factor RsiW
MNRLPRLTQTDLHLTDERMFALLDSTIAGDAHLDSCAECQTELATLRASLAHFQIAASNFSAQTPQLEQRQTHTAPPSRFRRAVWAASLATAAVLFTISASVFHPSHPLAVTPTAPPEVSVSDEALLDGIQTDLSTSIPPSLEPLAVPTATR